MRRITLALIFLVAFASNPVFAENPRVQIFVTSWCPYCQELEKFLVKNQVTFKKFDIEHDSEGAKRHTMMGGGGVPVIKVEGTIIRGFDPVALIQTLKSYRLWNPPVRPSHQRLS